MPGLNIVVGATVTNANQGLQSVSQNLAAVALNAAKVSGSLDASAAALIPLQNNLRNFEAALKKATNASEVTYLTRNINILKESIDRVKASSTGLGSNFTKGADQAGVALSNLGRVAQDAPFGFIAIQNNLNPLLESFQRLKAETGTVGGALKALGSSLIGAGGIGLALSVVSSILVKYPDLLSSLTREELAAQKAVKDFNEEMSKQQGSLQTELTRVSSLVQIARDYGESSQARTAAIKELQKEYPGYLANINQENINSQATQKAIENLTDALTRKAKVQAISNLLTKAQEDLYKTQNSALADNITFLDATLLSLKNFASLSGFGLDAAAKATKNQAQSVAILQANVSKLSAELDNLTRTQAENNDFQLLDPEKLKKTKDKVDQISELLRKLAIDRDELAKNPLLLFQEKDQKAFDLISSAINGLRDLKVATSNPIIVKLRADLDDLAAQIQSDKFRDRLKKTGIGNVVQIPVSFAVTNKKSGLAEVITKELADLDKYSGKAQKQLQKLLFDPKAFAAQQSEIADAAKQQAEIITSTISGVFESAGSATSIQGFFSGIAEVLGQGLKTLGKSVIETSTLIAAIKKALNTALAGNPIAGILTGIGLIAIGDLIQRSLPKFAEGGIAYGPTVGMFGEYGNARTNPEVVAPLDKLRDLLGTTESATPARIEVVGSLRNGDIFLSNAHATSSRRRLWGK